MTPLTENYRKNGYDFKLLERKGDVAIFEQLSEDKLIAYEVVEIIKQKEWSAFGKTYPAKEAVPSTESWGTNAFTCGNLNSAKIKAELLQMKINEREAKRDAVQSTIFAV